MSLLQKEQRSDFPAWLRALLGTGRALVYLMGAAAGYLFSTEANSFGGRDTSLGRYSLIFLPLILMVAAPVCWYLSVRTRGGDRWTVGYVSAWAAFIGGMYLAVLINRVT